jgi:hypothetical protein
MVEPADAQEAPKWDHGCDTGLFGTTAQTFIRKCVGLVDAASVALIDSCQGETNDSSNRFLILFAGAIRITEIYESKEESYNSQPAMDCKMMYRHSRQIRWRRWSVSKG